MKLSLIYNKMHYDKIRAYKDVKIISMSKDLEPFLKSNNIEFNSYKNYIHEGKLPFIVDKETVNLSLNWSDYVSNKSLKQLITHKGILLSEVVNLGFELYYQKVLTQIETIIQIIEKEKPEDVILIDDPEFPYLRALNFFNLKVQRIKVKNTKYHLNAYKRFIAARYFKTMAINLNSKLKNTKKDPETNKPRILLINYMHLDFPSLSPLIPELKKDFQVDVLALEFHQQKAYKEAKIPYKSFIDYNIEIDKKLLGKTFSDIKKSHETVKNDASFKENYRYKNIKLYEIVKEELNYIFRKHLIEAVFYIEYFNSIYTKYNVKAIVLASDVLRTGKTAAKTAELNKVASVTVQHGATGERAGRYGYLPISSDRFACWGKTSKKALISYGGNEKKIVITGCPRYDSLIKKQGFRSKEEIYALFNLKPEDKIIVYATNVMPEQELMFTNLARACNELNIKLVLALHPADKEEFYKNICSKNNWSLLVNKDFSNLFSLISYSELLITKASTVAIEAMIIGKPIVTMNFTTAPDRLPFAKLGAAIGVYKPEDLKSVISGILNDESTRKKLMKHAEAFLIDYIYSLDGRSTERVVKLIKGLIK
ncbi:MAG: CDP-glycerol glycerophosphotransferase family protein [Nanoarchaeota archaeon]